LPVDRKTVFASPKEFLEHHARKKLTPKQIQKMTAEAMAKQLEELE
jgi:hypothetical protein